MRRTPSRTRSPLLLAVLAASVLAACGGDDPVADGPDDATAATTTTTTAATPTAGADDDPFPVTIEHVWGTTTIEDEPERVVALGVTDADPLLALGITPVATAGYSFFESALGPWAEPLVEGQAPQVLRGEPNLELIASLRPDLIVGVSAGFEQGTYEQLSQIAPTIVRPAGTEAYQVPRTEATLMIGEAVGQLERAEELAADADARYAEAVAENPGFEGLTGVVVLPYDGRYGAYTSRDARGQVMSDLGFELPPALAELDTEGSYFIEVSQEQAGLLDADVVVMLADAPEARAFVDGDAVLQAVPAVADGRMAVPDTATRGAITYNSVLSVPYALDRLVPQLDAALAGR